MRLDMEMPEDEVIHLYLEKIRQTRPLIHHITNQVTMNDCANTAYAIGARPTMAFYAPESKQAAEQADAVVWNLGTFHPEMAAAIRVSLPMAGRRPIPVVIDPVAAQSYPGRSEFLLEILTAFEDIYQKNQLKCRIIIRCNAGELACLNEALRKPRHPIIDSSQSGGVDDLTLPGDHIDICRTFMEIFRERLPICIVMTGSTDYIGWTDPGRPVPGSADTGSSDPGRTSACLPAAGYPQLSLSRSCPLLTCMTGAGCMSNTLIAAFASVADSEGNIADAGHAARSALVFLVQSAQNAQKYSRGMGTFRINLMDELSSNIMI